MTGGRAKFWDPGQPHGIAPTRVPVGAGLKPAPTPAGLDFAQNLAYAQVSDRIDRKT